MEIIVNVVGQKLKLETNLKNYIAGSQRFIKFIFNLNDEWNGLTTFAQFIQNGTAYNAYLNTIDGVANCAYLPPEIQPGECRLLLYGSGGATRATTNYLTLEIDENILVRNASSTEISQSLYDQLVTRFNQAIGGKTFVAQSTSDMTDPTRIYVYVGSQQGYTYGNWYYHNGTNWVSGGQYITQMFSFGNGIADTNGTISVDIGAGLKFDSENKVAVKLDDVFETDSNGRIRLAGLTYELIEDAGGARHVFRPRTPDGSDEDYGLQIDATDISAINIEGTYAELNDLTMVNDPLKIVIRNGSVLYLPYATQEYADSKADTAEQNAKDYVDEKTGNATKQSKGVMQVGDGLNVNDGTVSVDTSTIATKSSVDTIADKTSILTKDENNAKFTGEVYVNNGTTAKKLATEEYVNNHTPAAATTDTLGTVIVGDGLSVADGTGTDAAGTIKVKTGTNLTTGSNGSVKLVDSPSVVGLSTSGNISVGGNVSVGGALTIDGEEVISANAVRDELSAALSGYGCGLEYDDTSNELYLVDSNGNPLGDGIEMAMSGGGGEGIAFDRGIVLLNSEDNKNYLHLQKENEITGEFEDVIDPIELPATGGGGGASYSATVNFRNTTLASQLGSPAKKFTAIKGRETLITYYWNCTDTAGESTVGNGTVQWYVGNNLVFTEDNVPQGNNSFDVSSYLSNGTNSVKIIVTSDEYEISRNYTWTINCSEYSVSWDKGAIGYYGAGNASIRITTRGSSSNGVVKKLYVAIDGIDNNHIFTRKDSPSSMEVVTITAQTHGTHTVYAWMDVTINGVTVSTDVIQHVGIWTVAGNNAIIIATEKDSYETQAYSHTPVKWMVVNPGGDSATVMRYINNSPFGGEIVAANGVTQEWVYTPTQSCTLKIASGLVYREVSFTVVEPPEGKRPYTDGMVMSVDPSGHNNNESTKTQFGYTDRNGMNHPFTYSPNFDWVNGGFQTGSDSDDNGTPAFVVKRGTWIEFDRSLFLTTDNTNGEDYSNQGIGSGKHISIIFKSKNVTDYDAEIARCYSSMGMNLYAQKALFRAGETMYCLYGEDRVIELSLNINPSVGSYGTMKWWLSGTPAEGRIFTKTIDSDGVVSVGTPFSQASPQNFRIGSDECDVWIYRFRMFNTFLTNSQVLRNYIADCGNADLINERYERNDIYDSGTGKIDIDKLKIAAPNLHIITIEASAFPQAKGGDGKTSCTIRHQIGNGVVNDQWVATNAKYTLQGTSSMSYRVSAGNIDIDMKNATMSVMDTSAPLNGYSMTPDSIPVKYFNLKANVASSENANNVCIAQLFNAYNPLVSKAKSIDGRIRDTVEGHPCVVFLKNTGSSALLAGVPGSRTIAPGDTIMYFAGDMNNSKKNTDVFGQTSEWDDQTHKQCCVEFANNDKVRCVFKAHNFENEQWDPGNIDTEIANNSHFEFRYPDGEGTEAMKSAFIEMHEWVWSTDCDPDETYGKPFSEDYANSITYNGVQYGNTVNEHKAYRLAKFKNELPNYFDVTNLLYYYLFTEFYLMVDNRSKNMFMSYEPDANGIWKWNVSKNYDDDTALGIDNKGGFSWEDPYTIEDTTRYGDSQTPCFNAANSVLWVNLRECFKTELTNMFNTLESAEGLQAVGGARLFDPDAIANMFDAYQRIRPEALMVDDHYAKYDQPIINADDTSYLTGMGHGEKIEQRRQFLKYRSKYISSKYVSASAKNDRILYQATNHAAFYPELQIAPYSTMYIGLTIDETPSVPVLVRKGETATLRYLDGTGRLLSVGGEQNLGIVNGSNITHIDGAGRLFPRRITYTLGKLQDILLGSDTYTNSNSFTVPFSAVPLAKKIDLRGLAGVNGEINLGQHDLLEELYLDRAGQGDGITLILPKSERITKLSLGNNVKSLVATDITNLTAANFSCDSTNMTSCRIENVPAIDTKELLSAATGIQQGRVTNVSWQLDSPDLLLRLGGLDPDKIYNADWTNTASALTASRYVGAPKGFTASGGELSHFYLSGTVQLDSATQIELTAIRAAFAGEYGGLTVNCSNIVSHHTVIFADDNGVVLKRMDGSDCIQIVRHGGSATNPINDLITERRIPTPAKQASKTIVYEFSNWSRSLSNITSDVTIKAVFEESPRMFTVRFYHTDKNGTVGSLIEEHSVASGGAATYGAYGGTELKPIRDGGYAASDMAVWVGFKLRTPSGSEYDEYGEKLSTQVVYSDIDATALYLSPGSLVDTNITRPTTYTDDNGDTHPVEYVYSDDPNDKGGWTLEEFYTVLCNCSYAKSRLDNGQKLKIGDKVKIVLDNNALLSESEKTIVMIVVGFECYRLADNSGHAKVVFHMKGTTLSSFGMIGTNDSTNYMAGWGDSSSRFMPTLRARLNDGYMNGSIPVPSIFSILPLHWRNMIKEVSVKYTIARTAAGLPPSTGVSNDRLFLPSIYEMGYSTTNVQADSAYSAELDSSNGQTLDYYTTNTSRIKGTFNTNGEDIESDLYMQRAPYHLRTQAWDNHVGFWRVEENGSINLVTYGYRYNTHRISFAFCI